MKRVWGALRALGALALWLSSGMAALAAEAYPSKPIQLVIAFPPGGPTDVSARLIAQAMTEKLGQQVLVDNRPGAGSLIASRLVAAAPADGYTLLYNTSSLLLGALMYTQPRYDPFKDFVPVIRTVGVPLVVAVTPGFPPRSVSQLVAHAKQHPGQVNYASSGAGTIDHLAGALLARQLGIDMMHVPYKGTAPALVDLVGGNTQVMVTTASTLIPYLKDNRLVPLAVASGRRLPILPEVPTMAEAARLPAFDVTAWNGIVAPAGTPEAIVQRLNAVVNEVLQQRELRARFISTATEIYGGTPEEYGAYLRAESTRWKTVAAQAGLKPE